MAAKSETHTPFEQVTRLVEEVEARAAEAGENVVGSGGFATVLGQLAENGAALTKLSNDAVDLVLRNLRIAGRRDIVRLSAQLARTEDKLERVLQELEDVHDQLGRRQDNGRAASRRPRKSNGTAAKQQKE